jgi:hypothetical protein
MTLAVLDAIRSLDAEAPSVQLVQKFIQFYAGRVSGAS